MANILAIIEKIVSDKKKLALTIIIFCVFMYLDIAFIMGFQLQAIKGASDKASKLQRDIASLSSDLAKIKESGSKIKEGIKIKKVFSEEEFPTLLQDIYTIANFNRVNILQINPVKEKPKETKPGTQPSKLLPVNVTIDLLGDYHKFGAFINDLENAGEFIAVEEIKIVPIVSDNLQQKANIILKTYVKI